MIRSGRIVPFDALICFFVFFGSVAVGAAGFDRMFSDASEMPTPFVVVLLLVVLPTISTMLLSEANK